MSIDSTSGSRAPYSPSLDTQIFNSIYEIGVSTGTGALAGWAFGIIDPVGGAVFGASHALTSTLVNAVADKLNMDHTALKTAACAISFIASVSVGIFATTTAGFPLTVLGSLGMLVAMAVTSIGVRIVVKGAGCLSSCIAGAALAAKERLC
jgi:hypothetical protein